ncbi:UDP-3-O-(3-hydroxymyristoyl)glucosamine N-acyltransferase [bacterium]|nr:UDP-3-O-(3-hydroxymyristoyl)glucosamine N-acyltransferase [bacterium]
MYSYRPRSVSYSLPQVAEYAECTLTADHGGEVLHICALEEPVSGGVVFVSSRKEAKGIHFHQLAEAGIIAVICDAEVAEGIEGPLSVLVSSTPKESFARLIPHFYTAAEEARGSIHHTAVIGERCSIDPTVEIGPYVVLGSDVTIGAGTRIHPHVVIYDGATIGAECTLHAGVIIREYTAIGEKCLLQSGAVIGADGFGYAPHPTEGVKLIPQVGTTRLEPGTDVGANSCIDRGALGTTRIGRGTKLDNLVQVGHNVQIGAYSFLCAQAGVAGSSKVGTQVTLGGQVGVADHLQVADGVRVGGKSGVLTSLPEKGDYAGYPAIPLAQWARRETLLKRLTESSRDLLAFLKKVARSGEKKDRSD